MSHFYAFMAGAFSLLALQHISMIPWYRRHRVKMALIQRAGVYLERAKKLKLDNPEEALRLHREIDELLNQASNIK